MSKSSRYERKFYALIQHLTPELQEDLRAVDKEVDEIIFQAFVCAKRTDAAIRAAYDGKIPWGSGSKSQLDSAYEEAVGKIFNPLAEAFWHEEIEPFMKSLRRIRELLVERPPFTQDYQWPDSVEREEFEWQIRKGLSLP